MYRMLFTYHCSVFSFTLALVVVTHTWGVPSFSVVVVGFCIGYSKTSLLGCSTNVFIGVHVMSNNTQVAALALWPP